jgi:hypothetical protein
MTMAREMLRAESAAAAKRGALRRAGADRGGLLGAGDLIAVIVPRQGETLLGISKRYYQEDMSWELARANGLPGDTIVPPRQPIVIPVRSVLRRLSQGAGRRQ